MTSTAKTRSAEYGRIPIWTFRLAVALGAVILAAGAGAYHFDKRYMYVHRSCPGTQDKRIDPIGVVFYDNGSAQNSADLVATVGRWDQSDPAFTKQYYTDHGSCRSQDNERADGEYNETRNHIRFWQQRESSARWGITTVGTPHYEVWNSERECHAVAPGSKRSRQPSGFDRAREELAENLGGYQQRREYWGNTDEQWQSCAEWYAGSNGYVVWFRI